MDDGKKKVNVEYLGSSVNRYGETVYQFNVGGQKVEYCIPQGCYASPSKIRAILENSATDK